MSLTLEEQEKILAVAEGLIQEERNWIKGEWRKLTRRKDINGERVCQFCIHGAVNQATAQVLGVERAKQIGAALEKPNAPGGVNVHGHVGAVAALGLDRVSLKLHDMRAMNYNDSPRATHEGVLKILRTRRASIRRSLGRKKKS